MNFQSGFIWVKKGGKSCARHTEPADTCDCFLSRTHFRELLPLEKPLQPLCLGKLNGSYVLAAESCAFDLVGAEFVRELDPGEIVIIGPDSIKASKRRRQPGRRSAFLNLSIPTLLHGKP